MAIPVQPILASAALALQDADFIRWTKPELIGYMNDGARILVTARPDISAKKVAFIPASGARQTLPDDAITLLDIIGNTNGSQRSIRKVDMTILSDTARDWQSGTKSATAVNFTYDIRDPYVFYLYPPSDGNGSVDLLHSVFPPAAASEADSIALPAQWSNALLNYTLSRAWGKDAEYGGNAAMSASAMAAFSAEASGQLKTSSTVSPKT